MVLTALDDLLLLLLLLLLLPLSAICVVLTALVGGSTGWGWRGGTIGSRRAADHRLITAM